MAEEQPLAGGRLTPGVVRVGDTVRRPASVKSAFTADLLRLLDDRGFTAAPRYLGQDESGRDMLTYLDGWVPARFQRWSDDQIAAVGKLLRAFHDATRGSALAAHHEVVCHHDPGPTNFVFQNDLPAALIDYDLAEPGSPLEDLGYAAWTWCIAAKHNDPDRQAHQVRVLVDAYGPVQRGAVIDATLEQQLRNARFWHEHPSPEAAERIRWSREAHAFTYTNRHIFEAELSNFG
ncbi:phosphotransferase [Kribbella sp. NPDC026611]|uniref:phosphotransferase n=1 Tax=Kribbella sp. NPDC026611 TaxID=3154911 RepID=UPI0033D91339